MNRTPLDGVIVGDESVNIKFVNKIQGMNIPVYAENEDSINLIGAGGK